MTTPYLDALLIPPVYRTYTLLKTSPTETVLGTLSRYTPLNYINNCEKFLSPYIDSLALSNSI